MYSTATPVGELHARADEIPDVYPAGRICARPRCGCYLNRFNPGPLCHPCGGPDDSIDTRPVAEALVELMEQV